MKSFLFILFGIIFSQNESHILLTRIVTQPDEAESISIYNPTESSINLKDYFICDDAEYYKIQTEGDMSPSSTVSGFTVQFPDININSQDTFHIVLNEDYKKFYGENFIPDLIMYGDESNSMLETESGSIGFNKNKIDEISELIILFKWEGTNNLIKDIDYFAWSSLDGISEVVDKSGIDTYLNDTPLINQKYFNKTAGKYYAYSRINSDEKNESQIGGNGISNHDETSENFRESWEISLLFNLGCTNNKIPNFDPNAEKDDGSCIEFTIQQIYNEWGSELISPCNDDWSPGREISTMGLIVNYQVTGGPKVITIEDENGFQLDVTMWDFDPMLSNKTKPFIDYYDPTEYIVLITGSLGIYNCNFQLEIESDDDINFFNSFHPFGEFKQDSSLIYAKIEPAPFILIPTLGEKLDFQYSFPNNSRVIIRIFDVSGRFITSIVDRYFEQAGTVDRSENHSEWDGKDHLGQIVQPGTYIIHIEATNPITGKTQIDAAPIVIGVQN